MTNELRERSAVWFKISKNASTSLRAAFMRIDESYFDYTTHIPGPHLINVVDLVTGVKFLRQSVIGDLTYEKPAYGKIAMVNGQWYESYLENFRYFYQNCFTFTVVRNPWARALSGYRYLTFKGNFKKPRSVLEELYNFKRILKNRIYQNDTHVYEHLYRPQTEFFPVSESGDVILNAVFRLEQLESDLKQLSDFLGVPEYKVPKGVDALRQSPEDLRRVHYSDFYDDEAKELVASMFAKDIQVLKYSFVCD